MVENTPNFEKVKFNYSTKNIPINNKAEYTVLMYQKVYQLIEKMRWKAFFFNQDQKRKTPTKRIFPTRRSAPQDKRLVEFENALYKIINNIKFKKHNSKFQTKMKNDLNKIELSNKLFVFADKSNNLYKVDKYTYEKILNEKICTEYKISNKNTINKINDETYNLIKTHNVEGKIPKLQQKQAFITIKDHKDNFPNKIQYRLINPTKSPFTKHSKTLIDKINTTIRKNSNLNQWKNTEEVITWFKNSKFNKNYRFIKFDITKFYPSITKNILTKALKFAESFYPITDKDISLIIHSCKTVLTHNNQTWEKVGSDQLFNVSMGSFNGAEICDLIGLFLLNEIKKSKIFMDNEFGLYRDDALAIIRSKSPRSAENTAKYLIKLFKQNGFKITIESGLFQTDFLDVSFNILNSSYQPYNKPNSPILYVNNHSNHPRQVLKQLPETINRRLIKLSNNEESYNNVKTEYQRALTSANYKQNIKYDKNLSLKTNKRKRNIIYFNPPFSLTVNSKIGKQFLNLINTSFDENHPYKKIFNRNTIKISYSSTANFKSKIIAHNNKILNKNDKNSTKDKLCNCRKDPCPLNNQCLISNIIYKAVVISNKTTKHYVGSTGNTFKERYRNHKSSFNNINKRHTTELANYIWNLKDNNTDFKIEWEILNRTKSKFNTKFGCRLCNLEKIQIDKTDKTKSLNKKSERQNICIHYKKFFFNKIKPN